jgi:hypothetical protein
LLAELPIWLNRSCSMLVLMGLEQSTVSSSDAMRTRVQSIHCGPHRMPPEPAYLPKMDASVGIFPPSATRELFVDCISLHSRRIYFLFKSKTQSSLAALLSFVFNQQLVEKTGRQFSEQPMRASLHRKNSYMAVSSTHKCPFNYDGSLRSIWSNPHAN